MQLEGAVLKGHPGPSPELPLPSLQNREERFSVVYKVPRLQYLVIEAPALEEASRRPGGHAWPGSRLWVRTRPQETHRCGLEGPGSLANAVPRLDSEGRNLPAPPAPLQALRGHRRWKSPEPCPLPRGVPAVAARAAGARRWKAGIPAPVRGVVLAAPGLVPRATLGGEGPDLAPAWKGEPGLGGAARGARRRPALPAPRLLAAPGLPSQASGSPPLPSSPPAVFASSLP